MNYKYIDNDCYTIVQEAEDIRSIIYEREQHNLIQDNILKTIYIDEGWPVKVLKDKNLVQKLINSYNLVGAKLIDVKFVESLEDRQDFGVGSTIFCNGVGQNYIQKFFEDGIYTLHTTTYKPLIIITDKGNLELQFVTTGEIKVSFNRIDSSYYTTGIYRDHYGEIVFAPLLDNTINKIEVISVKPERCRKLIKAIRLEINGIYVYLENEFNHNYISLCHKDETDVIMTGREIIDVLKVKGRL